MTLQEFEQLVADAIDHLPDRFAKLLDNVDVVVEVWPSREDLTAGHAPRGTTLFGLYRGIPQTKRGVYQAVLPDRISIFAGPIVRAYGTDTDTVRSAIRKTVLHEIGHHFGMSEEEIQGAMG
jgi:predicted Zn-dependent protease with MMP-like domain